MSVGRLLWLFEVWGALLCFDAAFVLAAMTKAFGVGTAEGGVGCRLETGHD